MKCLERRAMGSTYMQQQAAICRDLYNVILFFAAKLVEETIRHFILLMTLSTSAPAWINWEPGYQKWFLWQTELPTLLNISKAGGRETTSNDKRWGRCTEPSSSPTGRVGGWSNWNKKEYRLILIQKTRGRIRSDSRLTADWLGFEAANVAVHYQTIKPNSR